ncbi:MAG: copper homeostasis protein CutC [Crocinitomicaceae bacterium]|nr:copper homeostasis protein CutC [Crocinitomicaceae bacterium]MDG1776356.1 copper homeostasis protein CutC [Crocinitomicaceae bacterium]
MKLELCAASIEAIQIAKELNFDRIELCQSLEQGGLTPSLGLVDYALAHGVETHVLIRPRPGGFVYSQGEIELMIRNIIACGELGAQGVVIGALNKRGEIDKESISLMIENAKGMEVTFHRAFDDTANYKKSLDVLIDLGVKRLLSSGLEVNVERGMENLREMVDYARGRIEIMTGGGVNLSNVSNIVKEVKPDAIHFSGTKKILLDEGSMFSETILKPDRERIRKVQMALS